MSDTDSGPDLLNDLANDFAERYRRGERPGLAEYMAKYPELAEEIRDLFPAMAVIEEFGSVAAGPPGPPTKTATSDGVVIRRAEDGREVHRLPGSDGAVQWVEFNTRGTRLGVHYAGANGGPVVRVWDLTRGARPASATLEGATTCPVFRPDDRPALARLGDGGFGLFDVTSGRLVSRMALAFQPMGWKISADGGRLAVSGADRTVHVLDVERGEEVGSYPTESTVSSLVWRADGKLLAGGGSDGLIRVWDDEARRRLSDLEGHRHGIASLAFTHSGGLLVSTAGDGTTRVWEPVGGRLLVTADSAGLHLQVSADDRYVAHDTYGWGPTVLRLDTARECRVLLHGLADNRTPRSSQAGPADVDFSPDGRWLASAGTDGVRLWDAARGHEVAHLPVHRCVTARFQPDGTGLLTLGATGLRLWPIRSLDPGAAGGGRVGPSQSPLAGCGQEVSTARDGTGDRVAAIDEVRARAVVLDPETAREVPRLGRPPHIPYSKPSADGRWVATSIREGTGVEVRDVATGMVIMTIPCQHAIAAFSPDGRWLAVSEPGRTLRLWHVGSWLLGPVIEGDEAGHFAFSRDGRLLAFGTSEGVRLVEPDTGRRLAMLAPPPEAPPGIARLALSPDAGQLAVSVGDSTILLWDLRLVRERLAALGLDWDQPARRSPSRPQSVQ